MYVRRLFHFVRFMFNCPFFFFSADSSTSSEERIDKEASSMDASQKGKAVADLSSLRDRRKSRTLGDAMVKKQEIEATRPQTKGVVIKPHEPHRPSIPPKSPVAPPPAAPAFRSPSAPSSAPASESAGAPIVHPVCPGTEERARLVDEDDSTPISQLVPSPERPPLKRLRTSDNLKARTGSTPSVSLTPSKGKGDKGKDDEEVRGRLEEIPAKARSKVITAVMAMYKVTDKLALAYLDQMEEVGMASSEKEAREEKEEENQTLKAQLESMVAANAKAKDEAEKLKTELAMAKENWHSSEEKANQWSARYSDLELSVSSRVSAAESAKEKKMREEILPAEILKAVADFKMGEMAAEMTKAVQEGIDRFKAEELPNILQSDFVRGV